MTQVSTSCSTNRAPSSSKAGISSLCLKWRRRKHQQPFTARANPSRLQGFRSAASPCPPPHEKGKGEENGRQNLLALSPQSFCRPTAGTSLPNRASSQMISSWGHMSHSARPTPTEWSHQLTGVRHKASQCCGAFPRFLWLLGDPRTSGDLPGPICEPLEPRTRGFSLQQGEP